MVDGVGLEPSSPLEALLGRAGAGVTLLSREDGMETGGGLFLRGLPGRLAGAAGLETLAGTCRDGEEGGGGDGGGTGRLCDIDGEPP